jgi:hypothetical protein
MRMGTKSGFWPLPPGPEAGAALLEERCTRCGEWPRAEEEAAREGGPWGLAGEAGPGVAAGAGAGPAPLVGSCCGALALGVALALALGTAGASGAG